jgi:hypothetical protein
MTQVDDLDAYHAIVKGVQEFFLQAQDAISSTEEEHAMPPKGWSAGREATEVKAVRLPLSIIERIARHMERLQAQFRFGRITEGMAIRDLIEIGLDTVESHTLQPQPAQVPMTTQPALPLALEGVPASERVQPVEPAPATEAQPTRKRKTPSSQRKGGNPGIPDETLQRIADERAQCEGLSLRDFAQRLHDRGIYSATAKDGSKVPANPGNLSEWLKQAREQGLL